MTAGSSLGSTSSSATSDARRSRHARNAKPLVLNAARAAASDALLKLARSMAARSTTG
eukprot:CAMPEP_0115519072 /NCGR_PEP_ID=MMETSP0271-20121206/78235_1 /TAXON_ID=71861 /ORGANISM="Scrippsiella trochoidea, Strain CCMP3099" /LENGTH=57 /DNA_ID=CAMNT_0002950047 /DNA_START=43 /DNA_END=216 /DNA_ORIENTATION=+